MVVPDCSTLLLAFFNASDSVFLSKTSSFPVAIKSPIMYISKTKNLQFFGKLTFCVNFVEFNSKRTAFEVFRFQLGINAILCGMCFNIGLFCGISVMQKLEKTRPDSTNLSSFSSNFWLIWNLGATWGWMVFRFCWTNPLAIQVSKNASALFQGLLKGFWADAKSTEVKSLGSYSHALSYLRFRHSDDLLQLKKPIWSQIDFKCLPLNLSYSKYDVVWNDIQRICEEFEGFRVRLCAKMVFFTAVLEKMKTKSKWIR